MRRIWGKLLRWLNVCPSKFPILEAEKVAVGLTQNPAATYFYDPLRGMTRSLWE